jgi:hypothetical protein
MSLPSVEEPSLTHVLEEEEEEELEEGEVIEDDIEEEEEEDVKRKYDSNSSRSRRSWKRRSARYVDMATLRMTKGSWKNDRDRRLKTSGRRSDELVHYLELVDLAAVRQLPYYLVTGNEKSRILKRVRHHWDNERKRLGLSTRFLFSLSFFLKMFVY